MTPYRAPGVSAPAPVADQVAALLPELQRRREAAIAAALATAKLTAERAGERLALEVAGDVLHARERVLFDGVPASGWIGLALVGSTVSVYEEQLEGAGSDSKTTP